MDDDNFQLVTIAQLIAANNWLSHDTEDFIDAARTITSQMLAPVEVERDAAQARIAAALAVCEQYIPHRYAMYEAVAREVRAALTGEEQP